MRLTRWEPMNEMSNLARSMNQLFDDVWRGRLGRLADEAPLTGSWMPAVNIIEKRESIEITAELPGIDAKDVEVSVDNGVLTIRGERKFEQAAEGETYHRIESGYGVFERRFSMPSSVDPAKIEARFANGVMTLHLPKREESKPRSVKVKVEPN
jgi:HSP20 family protein